MKPFNWKNGQKANGQLVQKQNVSRIFLEGRERGREGVDLSRLSSTQNKIQRTKIQFQKYNHTYVGKNSFCRTITVGGKMREKLAKFSQLSFYKNSGRFPRHQWNYVFGFVENFPKVIHYSNLIIHGITWHLPFLTQPLQFSTKCFFNWEFW